MSSAWYAAFGLLAILSLLNAVLLVGVLRQVGILHGRIPPIGPGAVDGLPIGARHPRPELSPVTPVPRVAPFESELTLIGYVRPGCSVCATLPSIFRTYLKDKPSTVDLAGVMVTDAGSAEAAALADHLELDVDLPLFRSSAVASTYNIPGSPYVLALHREGDAEVALLASGIINELEQLEMLVDQALENRSATPAGPTTGRSGPVPVPSAFDLRRSPEDGASAALGSNGNARLDRSGAQARGPMETI